MTRGVSQLLFNYLPERTVDWEDGLAIVRLSAVRLAPGVWDSDRATVLLEEIAQYFDRWRGQGGLVDDNFPDPRQEQGRFAVGLPDSIEATVLDTAYLCLSCSALVFPRKAELAGAAGGLACPYCQQTTLRQFGQVFVHGCGELVPVTEWIPATKTADDGAVVPTQRPLRCPQCGSKGILEMPARSERVRDMRIVCRRCHSTVLERFTARCARCTRRVGRDRSVPVDGDTVERTGDTLVSRIAMRMSRYSANDTYYPQTVTLLRLDRPALTNLEDPELWELRRLLPLSERPDASQGVGQSISALAALLDQAQAAGDAAEQARLQARIVQLAMSASTTPMPEEEEDAPAELATDLSKSIRESLAFRTTVHTKPAPTLARESGGAGSLLGDEIERLQRQLGLREILLVDDLPVIVATFGYTRRSFHPTYKELSADNLPTEIRVFPSVDHYAAKRVGRPELVGTVPILAREGDHEGLFLSLDPERVLKWLELNGIRLSLPSEPPLTRILASLEPIDRYYDDIWKCRVRRLVFGLVHSLSHAAMRAASWFSGLERTSLSEYSFLPLLGTVIFDNAGSFRLGGIETLVRDHLSTFLQALASEAMTCVYDAECIDHKGACHGCIQSPEISCRVFNHGLSRAFLTGGHTPWRDVADDDAISGYWQLEEADGTEG